MHLHVLQSFGLAQCVLSRSLERFGDERVKGGGEGGGVKSWCEEEEGREGECCRRRTAHRA